jgi:hypothetical protein
LPQVLQGRNPARPVWSEAEPTGHGHLSVAARERVDAVEQEGGWACEATLPRLLLAFDDGAGDGRLHPGACLGGAGQVSGLGIVRGGPG